MSSRPESRSQIGTERRDLCTRYTTYLPNHLLTRGCPRPLAITLSIIILLLSACTPLPKNTPYQSATAIPIAPGTEDLVIDDFSPNPRLLISCNDRRHGNAPTFSGICSYDLQTGTVDTLNIKEYPFSTAFNPHGIDILQIGTRLHLYVVCHDDTAGHHWIADFQIDGNDLLWVKNYHAGLLTSPNEVTAMPDGSLYVTNDHHERNNNWESLLRKRVATIVHFRPDATHQVAYTGLAYGNGITQRNGYVYAAATVENAVYRFKINPDGTLTEKTRIAKVKGPDNLRWDGEDLLVACHLRLLKFVRHAKHAEKRSPTTVYRIQLGNQKPIPLYSDKGATISGGSTAVIYQNRLFISQVFENWIVEAKK